MCWEHHRGSRQCPDPRWWSGRCRALPAPPPHRAPAPTPASSSRCRRTSGGPRRRRSPPRASGEAERTGLLAQIRELPARHLVQVGLGGRRAHLDTGSGLGSRLEPTTTILCRQPRSMGCFSYLLSIPRLHRHPSPPRPSRAALGQRRGDLARQSHPAVPDPPSAGARGRVRRAAPRRWRVPVYQSAKVDNQPPKPRETSSPDTIVIENESLGLAIDCETATAHWHGERIDYDRALMVTMAPWDSGDTRLEAGPAAGDWNPS